MTLPVEHSFKCDTCSQHRRFGAARLTAEREASRHSMRWPDHIVHLLKTEIQHTFKRQGTAYHQLGDEAPF